MVINIVDLPENILLSILQLCNVQDLTALSVVSSLFHRLTKDSFLWRHLCYRGKLGFQKYNDPTLFTLSWFAC